jgi:hypothetical protein
MYGGEDLMPVLVEYASGVLEKWTQDRVIVWESGQRCLGIAVANPELSPHMLRIPEVWDDPEQLIGGRVSVNSEDGGIRAADAARMLRPAAREMRNTWDLKALGIHYNWDQPYFGTPDLTPWGDCPQEGASHSFGKRSNHALVAVKGLSPHQNHLLAHALADSLRVRKFEIDRR